MNSFPKTGEMESILTPAELKKSNAKMKKSGKNISTQYYNTVLKRMD